MKEIKHRFSVIPQHIHKRRAPDFIVDNLEKESYQFFSYDIAKLLNKIDADRQILEYENAKLINSNAKLRKENRRLKKLIS